MRRDEWKTRFVMVMMLMMMMMELSGGPEVTRWRLHRDKKGGWPLTINSGMNRGLSMEPVGLSVGL